MAYFIELPCNILIQSDSVLSMRFTPEHEDEDESTEAHVVMVPARLDITTSELVERASRFVDEAGVVVNRVYDVRGEYAEPIWNRFYNNESVTSKLPNATSRRADWIAA